MPRVSQEHLDARRRQILDAARRCFARNGFHATSMQDVFAEAGLSAGAVYRYFRSKEEIVTAIATGALAEVARVFDEVSEADTLPPLDEAIGLMFENLERLDGELQLAPLVVQIWGEAVRSPTLAAHLSEVVRGGRARFARLVETYQEHGLISGAVSAERVAPLLAGMIPGYLVQRAILGDVDAAMFRDGLRALLGSPSAVSARPA